MVQDTETLEKVSLSLYQLYCLLSQLILRNYKLFHLGKD